MGKKRESLVPELGRPVLPWVERAPGVPYFQTEDGRPWHPIGQNDAISWEELGPLYRRRDVAVVEDYISWQVRHGVTVMRLMLEYAHVRHRYFETAPGAWNPRIVEYWDDLFALCERHGMRLLLTPFDTFWMWGHFRHHPYSPHKGGPLAHPSRLLLSQETRAAIKARLRFAAERWGGSGAIFAWDVWNEIHPAQARDSAEPFVEFIEDLSECVRQAETAKFGRAHLQTVSLFGPELKHKAELQMEHAIFRHPALDFATIHVYEHGTIDDPRNTVDAAIGMGRIVREALAEVKDGRPFFDSEHGPIHSYKDHHITLPEPFDDEYFRHMQWAHLASGGAGGGMRWPNRSPHTLTAGMRQAQAAMSGFLPLVDWLRFDRHNVNDQLVVFEGKRKISGRKVARFGCASEDQALVYLLRRDALLADGRLNRSAEPIELSVLVSGLQPGEYVVHAWDTVASASLGRTMQVLREGQGVRLPPVTGDMAVAICRIG